MTLRLTRPRSGGLALVLLAGPRYAMLEIAGDGVALLYCDRESGRTWAWGTDF